MDTRAVLMTYSYIRLVYIDGQHHDFIYCDAASAKIAFSRYLEMAHADKKRYGDDAKVLESPTSLRVDIIVRYALAEIKRLSWSANLYTDVGFAT